MGRRVDRLLCHPAVSLGKTEGPKSISDVTLRKMGTVRADSFDPTPSKRRGLSSFSLPCRKCQISDQMGCESFHPNLQLASGTWECHC